MGFDDRELISTPKLALFSFPTNRAAAEVPGMATPPVNAAGTVPFEWEEAPGKPRRRVDATRGGGVRRCLDPPPGLLLHYSEAVKVAKTESPATVLDGPYLSRSLSTTATSKSFRKGKTCLKEKGLFGSSRWGSFRKNRGVFENKVDVFPTTTTAIGDGGAADCGGCRRVKVTRITRKGSMLDLYSKSSHLWASICEGIKQAIPWRRSQQEKMRRMSSATTL